MGLEASNFIPEMDPNNPLGGDPKSEGDDHIRLAKRSVLGSFPAFVGTTATPKSVSLTEDQINDAALKSAVQTILADWLFEADITIGEAKRLLIEDTNGFGQVCVAVPVQDIVFGGDNRRAQVRGSDAIDMYVGGVLVGRALPRAAGGLTALDLSGSGKKVGFRNPTLVNIAPGDTFLQSHEHQVTRSNVAAGVDILIATLEQGTCIRYVHTTTGTQTLAASGVTLELFNGLDDTITKLELIPGAAVELYWASATLVYAFGGNGVTGA